MPKSKDENLVKTRVPTYALVTPARNEAAFIQRTIECVIRQTVPPVKWVIVSDGSSDGTDEIVQRYTAQYSFLELLRMPERTDRHFAGKVHAFHAGYQRLEGLQFDIIGNLDADVTFEDSDYFEFLMQKFAEHPRLGVGGTPFQEGSHQYDFRFSSTDHVSGACQLFRRECYQQIGGYMPIRIGGIDLIAVISARMKGWETRTFIGKTCIHHRKMGTATQSALMVAFKGGRGDYMLGGHPLWEVFRCLYQMRNPPYVLAGMYRLIGFYWALVCRMEKPIPIEVVRFRRAEQMARLWNFIRKGVGLRSAAHT